MDIFYHLLWPRSEILHELLVLKEHQCGIAKLLTEPLDLLVHANVFHVFHFHQNGQSSLL